MISVLVSECITYACIHTNTHAQTAQQHICEYPQKRRIGEYFGAV